MILDERRHCPEAIGIVKQCNVSVDPFRQPRIGHIGRVLFAEMDNNNGELVLLRQMAELGVVGCVADVEDEEYPRSPLLSCHQLRCWVDFLWSVEMACFEEADCFWYEGFWVVLGFGYLGTPVRDDD